MHILILFTKFVAFFFIRFGETREKLALLAQFLQFRFLFGHFLKTKQILSLGAGGGRWRDLPSTLFGTSHTRLPFSLEGIGPVPPNMGDIRVTRAAAIFFSLRLPFFVKVDPGSAF